MRVDGEARGPHLSREEIVDAVEGRLAPGRRAHHDACEACRGEVDDLGAVWQTAADVGIPEPSPLFWEHQSRRIAEAIALDHRGAHPPAWRRWLFGRPAVTLTAGALVVILLGGVAVRQVSTGWGPTRPPTADAGVEASRPAAAVPDTGPAGADGEAADWVLLLAMTDAVEWGEVAAADLLSVDRHALDDTVFELTPEELEALGVLIAAELNGGEL